MTTEAKRSYTMSFRQSVAAASRAEQIWTSPWTGYIHAVYIQFPPGPSFLVDVRLMVNDQGADRQVVPDIDGTFIALDSAVIDLTGVNFEIGAGARVRVEWRNADGGFSHTVPVVVTLREK